MHARAWCEIDLDAVRANASLLRARAAVPLVCMVKADAYGLGAVSIARALDAPFHDGPADRRSVAHLPWALGVATVDEGLQLRNAGCHSRLLCCTPVLAEALPEMRNARITPSLHHVRDIQTWVQDGGDPWHLAIDTGMHRAGADWRTVNTLRELLAAHPPQGVFTHFHSAIAGDGSREEQERRFAVALEQLSLPSDTLRHTDATLALVARAPALYDLARPGISLYGSPSNSVLGLQPVLSVKARVVDVRDVAAGESVSYDASWHAPEARRIATVSIGHADGYRRAFSNRGRMLLAGSEAPVVGVVTMDMTMIDVTGLPCAIGDVATVVGTADPQRGAFTIDEVAEQGQLSPYELLAGWRLRLAHVYRGE